MPAAVAARVPGAQSVLPLSASTTSRPLVPPPPCTKRARIAAQEGSRAVAGAGPQTSRRASSAQIAAEIAGVGLT